jgi:hypothetical protein
MDKADLFIITGVIRKMFEQPEYDQDAMDMLLAQQEKLLLESAGNI